MSRPQYHSCRPSQQRYARNSQRLQVYDGKSHELTDSVLNLIEKPQNTASPPLHPSAPDGGIAAWLQVLGGFFLFMNTWGLINAFGVFQTYYSTHLLVGVSNSNIAWIGTLTSFLLCASPITWGPVFDLGSARFLVLFGALSVVFGIMMTSLCSKYWQLMLAQGICVGIGGGCAFITATSILPAYFMKRRALAMGLAASGSSLGGVIYPIIFHQLEPRIGFGWVVRIIGLIAITTLAIPCAVIRPLSKPSGCRKIFDVTILKELEFEMFNVATFLGFVGQYIPYFFIQEYAMSHDLGSSFWMLILLNVGSVPGRIVPSLIADGYLHPLIVLGGCTGCASVLAFCWICHPALNGWPRSMVRIVRLLFGRFLSVYKVQPLQV